MSIHIWKTLKSQSLRLAAELERRMEDFRELFEAQARESLKRMAEAMMEQEATERAGPRYKRGLGVEGITRAGSDPSTVRIGHQRVVVRKQRLKEGNKEVPLISFKSLRKSDLLTARVVDCMIHGLSTRDYDELLDEISGGLGLSKSTVSRAFIEGSRQALEHLQTRDLSQECWAAVMVDAIYFGKKSLVVAIGINMIGRKWILGMQEGNSESAQICIDLFQSLIARGLKIDQPFLFVLDGGKGLRKAVRDVFGERFPVQRCLVHKLRNLEEYVPKRLHVELRRRWARIRRSERYSDAKGELQNLRSWLALHSSEATASLDEAGEELLTCFRFGASRVLRRSFMTTNIIESFFGRVRGITVRIKNWSHPKSPKPDQIKRWSAIALLNVERKSCVIAGHAELAQFMYSLREQGLKKELKSA